MGLQFTDNSGNTRTLTLEDMKTDLFKESYFDLYKSLHGIKPRWETSPETMLRFFDSYEQELEEVRAEEARELAQLGEQDGVQYTSWSHYYDLKEAVAQEKWEAEQAKLLAQAKARKLRGGILDTIEDWEYGSC